MSIEKVINIKSENYFHRRQLQYNEKYYQSQGLDMGSDSVNLGKLVTFPEFQFSYLFYVNIKVLRF